MVFNNSVLLWIIFLGCVAWLSMLTFLLLRMISHYNKLGEGSGKQSLQGVMEDILTTQHSLVKKASELESGVKYLSTQGELHIQRIGIVRFNPFADTGGAQSFSIALLDGLDNGIVMTSLYGRAGNRWYVKELQAGKGKGHELSKEEQEAIRSATRGGKLT